MTERRKLQLRVMLLKEVGLKAGCAMRRDKEPCIMPVIYPDLLQAVGEEKVFLTFF